MLSYRLIHHVSLNGRSRCIHCNNTIAWCDLAPLVSWLILRGACRYCHQPISFLYPFIEFLTCLIFTGMVIFIPYPYWFAYTIFFSALIITIRSDLDCMLISRFVTLFLVPIGIIMSSQHLLPITVSDSIAGAIGGYAFLWFTATLFSYVTGKNGMGQGDIDLLCFIGSFTGVIGCWVSLVLGSLTGSIVGLGAIALHKSSMKTKIPFGPFLALGALLFVFLSPYFFSYIDESLIEQVIVHDTNSISIINR